MIKVLKKVEKIQPFQESRTRKNFGYYSGWREGGYLGDRAGLQPVVAGLPEHNNLEAGHPCDTVGGRRPLHVCTLEQPQRLHPSVCVLR